ncbi:MAG: hypothetical protein ACYCZO_12885 [Daejeonella sp.]
MKRYLFTSLLLMFMNISCQKDTGCNEERSIIPTETLPSSETFTLKNIDDSKNELGLVIRSQVDYEKFVNSNSTLPKIDFTKKFLIAVRVKLTSCGEPKDQSVVLQCNQLTYHTVTEVQLCLKLTDVFFFTLIDNIYKDKPVQFHITKV